MEEGTGISLYVLVGIIIFGLFVGISVLFGEGILASSGDIIACVESYMSDEPTECGISGEDDEIPEYVLATDDDFVGTTNGTFKYTGDAEYVKLPHTIKGVPVTSYDNMFKGSSVKKVISDNPNVTSMKGMFEESKAKEIDISGINTSNVTNMNNMFSRSQATEIKGLENFNTSNVTSMGGMFRDSNATKIKGLENLNTSNVRSMAYMFTGSKATEFDISNFNTSNVSDMSGMFYNSQNKKLDVSNFDTSKVKNMYAMFYGSQATELDLSSFDTSNVTSMYNIFGGSQAKTVYARTQVDADKFNASSGKPNGLQVIVKQ